MPLSKQQRWAGNNGSDTITFAFLLWLPKNLFKPVCHPTDLLGGYVAAKCHLGK